MCICVYHKWRFYAMKLMGTPYNYHYPWSFYIIPKSEFSVYIIET